jgi:hypothetical protein
LRQQQFSVRRRDRQNALPQNAAGYRAALEIALANAEHRFVFGAAAWQILPQPLPFAETIALRQRLSMFSTARLQAGFLMSPWGPLHALFRDHHTYSTIACVLIEHGLAPYVDDFGGELGVSPSEDASAF